MLPNRGKDGREVELRKGTYFIQWRYKGEPRWRNLIAIDELKGAKGKPGNSLNLGLAARQVQLRSENGYVQWRWSGQRDWTNLYKIPTGGSGGGGPVDYNDLTNKPDLTKYVSKTGDTMTGNLILSTNTINPLELATTTTAGWQELNMSHMGAGNQNIVIFNAQNSANVKTRYAQIQAMMFERQKALGSIIISTNSTTGMRQIATFLAGELRLENSKLTFGASDVAMIAGTGFPNGVVVAPVGSIYIDKSATNGATRWVKQSGTGNTGWVVDYGNTGWRNITPNPLPANIKSTNCKIRRVNDTVELAIGYTEVISATETVYISLLPQGFQPTPGIFITGESTGPGTSRSGGVAVDGNRVRLQASIGQYRTAYITYSTNQPYSTELPGTAI